MADREREKKKKRAYLDDFEKDLNGNYQYRGAHYRYASEHSHSRALALLWLFCGSGAALTVGAGALPGATAHAPVYLLLPYMAALVLALYAVVLLLPLRLRPVRATARPLPRHPPLPLPTVRSFWPRPALRASSAPSLLLLSLTRMSST